MLSALHINAGSLNEQQLFITVGVVVFEVFLCTSYLCRSTHDARYRFVHVDLFLSFSSCVFRFLFIRHSSEYCDCLRPHCKFFESMYRGNECTSAPFCAVVVNSNTWHVASNYASGCGNSDIILCVFFYRISWRDFFYWPKYEQVGAVVHCASLLVGKGGRRTLIG
jgi:hypothetical protein